MDSLIPKLLGLKTGANSARLPAKLRDFPVNETQADDFLCVLNAGGAAANHYLRRNHNFAREMDWPLANVIAKKVWPKGDIMS